MTAPSSFLAGDRLLVFAPHPDDETLAAGELIQSARDSGASVRVVFATDGDNNPWPQRWLERRWRIGAGERARWGARRRAEAITALHRLGFDQADTACFLGWPDQGLTDSLMRDDSAVDRLVTEISGFVPTHVVLPTLADRHPDHSALRVMLELALLRSASNCTRLGYVVHAAKTPAISGATGKDPAWQRRKQHAMQAYASQMSLSRRRLITMAERSEEFEVAQAEMPAAQIASTIHIPQRTGWLVRQRHELLLVIATSKAIHRWRVPMSTAPTKASEVRGHVPAIDSNADGLSVRLPPLTEPILAVYSKIHRRGPRLLIFDRQPWHEAVGHLQGPLPTPVRLAAEEVLRDA
jgi:LmbE family N-acetylglucosaminyl deacetylase